MATQRTPEERMEIARQCRQLEKEGGDVLAYLLNENYYTPRATWYNMQRELLNRKPWQCTDGRPKKKGGVNHMALTNEQRLKAAQIAIDGGDPRVFLEECGILNTTATWFTVKEWLKKNHPEMAGKVPEKLKPAGEYLKVDKGMPKAETVLGRPKEDFEKLPTVKVDGGLKIETPEGNRVEVAEVPEKHRIKKPVSYDGFEVTAIRDGSLGEFYYDRKYESIDWRTVGGDEVSMGPVFWRELYEKLPRILGVLGVDL